MIHTLGPHVSVDATVDESEALSWWLSQMSAGDTADMRGAKLLIEGGIFARLAPNITLLCDGLILVQRTDGSASKPTDSESAAQWPYGRCALNFPDAVGLTIGGGGIMRLHGTGVYDPALEGQHAIRLASDAGGVSHDVTIGAWDIHGAASDSLYIAGANKVHVTTGAWTRAGRQHIGIVAGNKITIDNTNGSIFGAGMSLVDIEPNDDAASVRHIEIFGGTVGGFGGDLLSAQAGGALVGHIVLRDMTVIGYPTIQAGNPNVGHGPVTISNIRAVLYGPYGSPAPLMRFTNIYGVTVRDCAGSIAPVIPGIHCGVAIAMQGSHPYDTDDSLCHSQVNGVPNPAQQSIRNNHFPGRIDHPYEVV